MTDALAEALEGRHPSTREIAQFFAFDHLPEHLQWSSEGFCNLAVGMILSTPDSPELTVGLRKLLEAKDCFVRCQVARKDLA